MFFVAQLAIDVIGVSTCVARLEAKEINLGTVQTEGIRHPSQHVCQVQGPNPRLEYAASATSGNGAHELGALKGRAFGFLFYAHLELLSPLLGASH